MVTTAASSVKKIEPEELGIQSTLMAIREELMKYFKGTCIDRLTDSRNVRIRVNSAASSYFFERRRQENERVSTLFIANVPIARIQHAPERIVFYSKVLSRSPQLKRIHKELEAFMEQYLAGVERSTDNANFI